MTAKQPTQPAKTNGSGPARYGEAVKAIKRAVEMARYKAARSANGELLSLYYGIGRYVSENTRDGAWGTDAIRCISAELQRELPGLRGFSATNIRNMRLFYESWCPFVNHQTVSDDFGISNALSPASRQPVTSDLAVDGGLLLAGNRQKPSDDFDWGEFLALTFSHHIEIFTHAATAEERLFYVHQCAAHAWSLYDLRDGMQAGLYRGRGTLPNNFARAFPTPEEAMKATMAFKDNYLLDFINIENLGEKAPDRDERVIENEIVAHVKDFLLRFGADFVFMGNQWRVEVMGEEMFIDLLFLNRELNCLVAVELKAGKFKPAYLGQLTTYLRALDDVVRKPHENPSIGLILCKDMNKGFVDYVIQDYDKPMGVATYKTLEGMPDRLKKALPDTEALRKLLETAGGAR